MTDNKLAILEQADKLLAEIKTVDDARHLMARAEAARAYAKEIKMGFEVQNTAAEIKLRAQRAAGGVIYEMKKRGEYYDREKTGDVKAAKLHGVLFCADLGINQKESEFWQAIYRMPQHIFEQGISQSWQPDEKGRQRELTTWGLYQWGKSYGKQPTETKKVMTPAKAFDELKQAIQTIKDNIAYLESSKQNGGGEKYYLTWVVRALTEIAVYLAKKGYGNEPDEQ